jgi:Reeler domain
MFTFTPGQTFVLTLRTTYGFKYEDFIIQARRVGETEPAGRWRKQDGALPVGCRDPQSDFSGDDTAIQQPFSTTNVQSLNFTVPSQTGRYFIYLTVIEKFGVFWQTQSREVFVSHRAGNPSN